MKKEYEELYITKDKEGEALKRLIEIVKVLRLGQGADARNPYKMHD